MSRGSGVGRMAAGWLIVLLMATPVAGQQFYPDDPLTAEPPPFPVYGPESRALSEILELVSNTLGSPGERHPEIGIIPSQGINTLGEVLDGPWFVNRHGTRRLTREELIAGPGRNHAPADGVFRVLNVEPYGFRPGILVADARDQLYLLIFDPRNSPEMSTGAQMVGSHAAHAIGYHVPETYIVTFERERLILAEGAEITSSAGNSRALTDEDLDVFLREVARTPLGRYRAAGIYASEPSWQGFLGPFQLFGTRSDDPNDIVPHEHRRDQRGLSVVSAWLNFSTFKANSTVDVMLEEDGIPRIRHYIVDFFASLGSGVNDRKRFQEGNDPLFDRDAVLRNIVGFGLWTPDWMKASYPNLPAVGRLEYATFDPERWISLEGIAPFENALLDDQFWGAKQVMAFTDDDVAALVSTGEYRDAETDEWIVRCLIERRDRIGRTYFTKIPALDNFRIEDGRLQFDDLAVVHGFAAPADYTARWFRLDNESRVLNVLQGAESFQVPDRVGNAPADTYFAARVGVGDPESEITVSFRTRVGGLDVVGLERTWPGKVIADPTDEIDLGESRFASLEEPQEEIYAPYAEKDMQARGREMTVAEHFDAQTISERTTYDAVTHALMNSKLTDVNDESLGTAFDRIESLDRIAGQYYGRGGDQQFRLYVNLKPDTDDTLDRSTEFFRDHLNTVYHVGYPHSFRQEGKVPNIQFSISDDGLTADIDVDYRSSKSPGALFNGHLTSANSDVRAGDNLDRHNGRWQGMIGWWRGVFGQFHEGQEGGVGLLAATAVEVPTDLPPNRPPGAPIEAPEDAIQEFLTDWLVRQDIDEAMSFMSDRAYACVNVDDDAGEEALGASGASDALRELMSFAADRIGPRSNLTVAVDAVKPFSERVLTVHNFDGEFGMADMTPEESQQYVCGQENTALDPNVRYIGAILQFKQEGSAILGLLWAQQDGEWKLLSYQIFEV